MFILEESQLLEDTINNPSVLDLYKKLRKYESSNNRSLFIEILASDSCQSIIEILISYCALDVFSSLDSARESFKLAPEQRDEVCKRLNLERGDVAALLLIFNATLNQIFVIDNFVGPTNKKKIEETNKNLPEKVKVLAEKVDLYKSLSQDGSEVYHQVTSPWSLKLAQLSWLLLNNLGCSRKLLELEFLVWKHRYLTVYLMTLLEPSETLLTDLKKVQDYIFDHHILNNREENNTQLVRFNTVELCCELVQSSLLRGGITSCRKIMDYASELSGFAIEHAGVLGKRTKFQHRDIPQLVVKVTRKKGDKDNQFPLGQEHICQELPKDIKLDDDTLLPDITFVDEDAQSLAYSENLDHEAQLLMLTQLDYILKTEVMEESLKDEWTLAYLRCLTKFANIWLVKYKALEHRCVVEKKHMRKMDRALLQMEELIKTVESNNNQEFKRMELFYSIMPLSYWQTQRSLGDISFDLGLSKNALDVYLRIEHWEGIIRCYNTLGQTVKAQKIIQQELEKNETPYLYCLLGDATENIDFYEKSWLLSKCRFARAKKSIGTYYYVRKDYDKAIENYELALSASPSNVSILTLLAYSCLTVERFERAAECYRNITYIDDGNFLAWNNLSKAYIKLGQKERAWRTLKEAIKCNFDEWKIWENFMMVSIDVEALSDVITAWHRIIDIKSSHKDDQILARLTWMITKQPYDKVDHDYMRLLGEAIKLVARLNATSECSPRMWICYYKLLIKEFGIAKMRAMNEPEEKTLSKMDIDSRVAKITNALQRAAPTSLTADLNWMHEPEKIDRVLKNYNELVDCYSYALEVIGPRPELWRQWKCLRLLLQTVMKCLDKKGYKVNLEL